VEARHGAIPQELAHGHAHWRTIITSMLLAPSLLALLANLIALAVFAPSVEEALGRARFLGLYALGGVLALAVQLALEPNATAPLVGSCGALAAILGAYLALYPRARVLALVLVPFLATIVAVPAVPLIGLWWGAELWLGLAGLAGPLGGHAPALAAYALAFSAGLLAIRPLARRRTPDPPVPAY